MEFRLAPGTSRPILVCASRVERVADALDVVSATYEHGSQHLLLDERDLPDDFFDLRTGFLGEFVQKLINYHVTTAAVFRGERAYSQRFREYVDEARNGRQFRTFADAASALAWLDAP